MRPTLALDSITAVAAPHRTGHRCQDGLWWNPNAGARTPCPVDVQLQTAAAQITDLHEQTHAAAHDDDAVRATVQGMTGWDDTDWVDLTTDDRNGWMLAGRLAIEALAVHLDRDSL